jgi:hypothetical protein
MLKRSKKKSNKNQGSLLNIGRGRLPCPAAPPVFQANLVIRKKFRFLNKNSGASSGTVYTITSPKVCGLMSVGTVTNSTVVQLFEAVRLLKVTVWSAVNQTSGAFVPVSVAVAFPGVALGVAGADILHSDMSVGATRIARVCAKPESSSQASQWQSGQTGITSTWFTINAGYGSVIDLDIEGAVTSDSRTTANSATVTTAAVGAIYYMALDNAFSGAGSVGSDLIPTAELVTTV